MTTKQQKRSKTTEASASVGQLLTMALDLQYSSLNVLSVCQTGSGTIFCHVEQLQISDVVIFVSMFFTKVFHFYVF